MPITTSGYEYARNSDRTKVLIVANDGQRNYCLTIPAKEQATDKVDVEQYLQRYQAVIANNTSYINSKLSFVSTGKAAAMKQADVENLIVKKAAMEGKQL